MCYSPLPSYISVSVTPTLLGPFCLSLSLFRVRAQDGARLIKIRSLAKIRLHCRLDITQKKYDFLFVFLCEKTDFRSPSNQGTLYVVISEITKTRNLLNAWVNVAFVVAGFTRVIPMSNFEYTFVSNVPNEYICSICRNPMRKPQQTRCGHRFCKHCLETAGDGNNWSNVESNIPSLLFQISFSFQSFLSNQIMLLLVSLWTIGKYPAIMCSTGVWLQRRTR